MHPVRELQERCQSLGLELKYVRSESGDPPKPLTECMVEKSAVGRCVGISHKQTSRKLAARDSIAKFYQHPAVIQRIKTLALEIDDEEEEDEWAGV